MNKKELDRYKQLLLEERTSILGGVEKISGDVLKKSSKDASGDLSGYTLHIADMATDNYDREFSLGIADTERATLVKIDDALKRVALKSYGKCLLCKKDIAKKRLAAVPHAEHCKKCQEKEEADRRP